MSNDNNEFQDILKSVIDENGAELLKDAGRMNAFLLDLAPEHGKYRKLISAVLQEDIGELIFQAMNKDNDAKDQSLKKCLQRLKSETWLTESAMILGINMVAYSVGFGCQLPEYKEPEPVNEPTAPAPKIQLTRSVSAASAKSAAPVPSVSFKSKSVPDTQRIIGDKIINKGDISDVCADISPYLKNASVIGYKAFIGNSMLKRVIIPDNVKIISGKAFSWCINLEIVSIPRDIEKIGERVFEKCPALRQISLENSPKYTVSNNMLINKEKKRVMKALNTNGNFIATIPHGVKSVAPFAFENSNAVTINIPSTLERIGKKAFYECSSLRGFDVDSGNFWFASYDGVLYSNEGMHLILYPQGKRESAYYMNYGTVEICDRAFMGAVSLESVIFVNTLRKIGESAFQDCHNLISASIQAGVTVIGAKAFQGCESLFNITLPSSIKEIGDFTFSDCRSIKALTIPPMVDRIGHGAFQNCCSLERIVVQEGVCFIGNGAFSGCSDSLVLYVRNNKFVEQYCKAHGIGCVAL